MQHEILGRAHRLRDDELVARTAELARTHLRTTAELVAHLAEIDRRQIYLRLGYGSLFEYCRTGLRLGEGEAGNRIMVARTAGRFPLVLDLLQDGRVTLTAVRLLTPHLTDENHQTLLATVTHRTREEVQRFVAGLAPRPDVPTRLVQLDSPTLDLPLSPSPATVVPGTARPPAVVQPLTPARYRFQVTLDHATVEKLRLARDLLRHAVPGGDEAAVIDRALTLLVQQLQARKAAVVRAPRPQTSAAPSSRRLPAHVRRAVWLRDGGRCAYVSQGRRCGSRHFLEFHHRVPFAMGGEATVANVALFCRNHNADAARADFGSAAPRVPARVPEHVPGGDGGGPGFTPTTVQGGRQERGALHEADGGP